MKFLKTAVGWLRKDVIRSVEIEYCPSRAQKFSVSVLSVEVAACKTLNEAQSCADDVIAQLDAVNFIKTPYGYYRKDEIEDVRVDLRTPYNGDEYFAVLINDSFVAAKFPTKTAAVDFATTIIAQLEVSNADSSQSRGVARRRSRQKNLCFARKHFGRARPRRLRRPL